MFIISFVFIIALVLIPLVLSLVFFIVSALLGTTFFFPIFVILALLLAVGAPIVLPMLPVVLLPIGL